eukprot:jgi/Botrbrau1/15695/Bobra.4_1s0070.2
MFTRQCLHTSRNFRAATRGLVRAVAETEKQAEPEVRNVDNEPRTLSFGNNSRSGVGYTAEDSAGQSNIFAVEPKVYVQGSNKDTTTGSSDNLLFAVTAAVLGIGAIAVGLSITAGTFSSGSVGEQSTVSLSQYKTKFEASLAKAPKL